jgi:hypothetical protein
VKNLQLRVRLTQNALASVIKGVMQGVARQRAISIAAIKTVTSIARQGNRVSYRVSTAQ